MSLTATQQLVMIPIDGLMPDPSQPRKSFSAEETSRLAASIAARGILNPIRVTRDDTRGCWKIISGENRWRAARVAGFSEVPCLSVEGDLSETDLLAEQIIENEVRQPLRPIETARAIARLKLLRGCNSQTLAKEYGFSKSAITVSESLLGLPGDIQALVDSGRIAETTAYYLSRLPDPESQREMAALVMEERLSRDQTAKAVRRKLEGRKVTRNRSRLPFRMGGVSLTVAAGQPLSWKDLSDLMDRLKREIKKFADGEQGASPATPLDFS